MDSPRFMFPHRAFPGIVRRRETASLPHLLFTQVGTDAGLRHAAQFYWNAKKITLAASGSATSRNYVSTTEYPYPPVWAAQDYAWSWDKSYCQYDADATATDLWPLPTIAEREMQPPMTRIHASTGWRYASDPITYLAANVRSAFTVAASDGHDEMVWLEFIPTQIVWSLTHDRYALVVQPKAAFTGSDSVYYGDGEDQTVSISASLRAAGYVPTANETAATLNLPAWLETPCPFITSRPVVWNPIIEENEYPFCSMTMDVSVEFWSYH